MVRLPRLTRAPLYLAAAAAFAACSTEVSTNPASAFSRPLFAVGGLTDASVTPGVFKVCKSGSDGTFTVSVSGPQTVAPHSVVVVQGTCQSVAEYKQTGLLANVTVTETSPNFKSVTVVGNGNNPGVVGSTVKGGINFYHGVTASYVNSAPSKCSDDDDKAKKDDDKARKDDDKKGGDDDKAKKDDDDCKKKKCDADKSAKDPKKQNEDHDCRSENGEEKDKNYRP
ncbi:MAG: hypothetical protein M3068_10095 [Gemmatimonadota bacterium]|nr:hypothetical protein [Gemmatimonadota bacterium]